jgi:hypothetical protein
MISAAATLNVQPALWLLVAEHPASGIDGQIFERWDALWAFGTSAQSGQPSQLSCDSVAKVSSTTCSLEHHLATFLGSNSMYCGVFLLSSS